MGRVALAMLGLVSIAAFGLRSADASAPVDQSVNTARAFDLDGPAHLPRQSAVECLRWRMLASRLGETYAGYRLRQTVVARKCALLSERVEDDTWSWPWRHHDVRADLPPQHAGVFGAWEIRCGEAGKRRRCALALETVMPPHGSGSHGVRVIAHIVIDAVAGRESVLWRVHVAPGQQAQPAGSISIALPSREAREPFDACGRRGCMAEAGPAVSAEVATLLWSGKPIPVTITGGEAGTALTGYLPADGFRRGLGELILLRGREGRTMAGGR